MNSISGHRAALLVGTAFAAALLGGEASAQNSASGATALEEIVVTARRREENLQTTPVAITAVTAETLERRNITTLDQVARLAPSLTVYETPGGLGTAGTYMRGIGYGDYIPGQDSPVAIYIDGVIAGRTGIAMMQLVEPERVEVLRGPQGTLFGRNTAAGAILITTHKPSDEFGGMAKASYGSFQERTVQARVDSGLLGASGLKFSAAYQHRQRNGSFNAPLRPRDLDPGAQTTDTYWFKLVGEWDKFSATLAADYTDLKGTPTPHQVIEANAATRTFIGLSNTLYGGPAYVITPSRRKTISEAYAGLQHVWSEGVSLTLNYEISDNLSLKSISGLRAYKRDDPWGFGPNDLRGNVGTAAAPRITSFPGTFALIVRGQSQRQRSQELQLLGNAGDFEFVGGLYYFKEDAWDASRQRLPVIAASGLTAIDFMLDRVYTVDSKSIAGFAQVGWRPSFLDKKLELAGGVRRTKDDRKFVQTIAIARTADLETKDTSYLVSANYQWTPGAMTFVRYSTGYRAGGFNARAAANVNPTYEPEKLKSLEAGFKFDFLNNRVRLNGAAFYNKYRDLQVTVFVPPSAGTGGGNVAINADAKYKGFELELQAVPVEGLTLGASLGYVDSKYTNYPRALEAGGLLLAGCTPITNGATVVAQNCADVAKFIFAPKTTGDLSVNYELPKASYGQWSFFASYSYKSKVDFSVFRTPASPYQDLIAQKGWWLLSARVALSDIPISGDVRGQIALFGDNLTDEKYHILGSDFGTYAALNFAVGRTIGIEGKVEF
jgi:iron complex outermembrane receptor protein